MLQVTINRYSIISTQILNGIACELKICENCGKSFTRKTNGGTKPKEFRFIDSSCFQGKSTEKVVLRIDHGRKYCVACCSAMLLPINDDEYREMLPKIQHHGYHLPKYDNSLLPVIPKEARAVPAIPRKRHVYRRSAGWKPYLLEGFSLKNEMTLEEISEFIPDCFTPREAYIRCKGAGVKLTLVGRLKTEGIKGHGAGIFKLESLRG